MYDNEAERRRAQQRHDDFMRGYLGMPSFKSFDYQHGENLRNSCQPNKTASDYNLGSNFPDDSPLGFTLAILFGVPCFGVLICFITYFLGYVFLDIEDATIAYILGGLGSVLCLIFTCRRYKKITTKPTK